MVVRFAAEQIVANARYTGCARVVTARLEIEEAFAEAQHKVAYAWRGADSRHALLTRLR